MKLWLSIKKYIYRYFTLISSVEVLIILEFSDMKIKKSMFIGFDTYKKESAIGELKLK